MELPRKLLAKEKPSSLWARLTQPGGTIERPRLIDEKIESRSFYKTNLFHEYYRNIHVHEECRRIWRAGRAANTTDGYIGLLNCDNGVVYLAPCFAVQADVPPAESTPEYLSFVTGDSLLDDRNVLSANTSANAAVRVEKTRGEVKGIYQERGACFVPLNAEDYLKPSFDGKSHRAMRAWVHRVCSGQRDDNPYLGWAIQYAPDSGYLIRYASGLNQREGQVDTKTIFSERRHPNKDEEHEVRDLPRDWSILLDEVLNRDLGIITRYCDRIVSRDVVNGITTKRTWIE